MKQVLRGGIQDQDKLALLRCARLTEVGRSLTNLSPQVMRFCIEQDSFVAVEAEWVDMGEDPEVLVEEIEMLEDIDSSEEDSDSPVPVWENLADTDKTKGILKSASDPSPASPYHLPHQSHHVRCLPREMLPWLQFSRELGLHQPTHLLRLASPVLTAKT